MDDLGDRLVSLAVTATSPDGQIRATFGDDGAKIEIAFHPGSYSRYSESSLEHELSHLAMRVMASYVRARTKLLDEKIPGVLHDDGIEYGPKNREFHKRIAAIKVGAESPDGKITVLSHSLTRWEVRIADGTVRRFPEEAFKERLVGAVRELLAQYRFEVLKIRDEYYDLGISDETRRQMGLPGRGSR